MQNNNCVDGIWLKVIAIFMTATAEFAIESGAGKSTYPDNLPGIVTC